MTKIIKRFYDDGNLIQPKPCRDNANYCLCCENRFKSGRMPSTKHFNDGKLTNFNQSKHFTFLMVLKSRDEAKERIKTAILSEKEHITNDKTTQNTLNRQIAKFTAEIKHSLIARGRLKGIDYSNPNNRQALNRITEKILKSYNLEISA